MDIINSLTKTIECQVSAINSLFEMDLTLVEQLVIEIDEMDGKVVFIGVGKSGRIAQKATATMQSLGLEACFLQASEALHGDLGLIKEGDIVIFVSKSGESEELIKILPSLKKRKVTMYSITNKSSSILCSKCKNNIIMPYVQEALLENIVPTSSTTQLLVLCDAIAVAVAEKRKFTQKDFSLNHPNGLLGKLLLLKVDDLMKKDNENAVVNYNSTLQEAIMEMCSKPTGAVNILDENNNLLGIFTDGDLRRLIASKEDINFKNEVIMDYITKNPLTFESKTLISSVVQEVKKMDKRLSTFPIVKARKLIGTLCISDILKEGLYD